MVHGPGDLYHRLSAYVKRMDDRRPVILLDEGLARWKCPRGYVDNVAAAIALAVVDDRATGGVFNVADPVAFTEAEWVHRIGEVVGWRGKVVTVPGGRIPVPYHVEQNLDTDSAASGRSWGIMRSSARGRPSNGRSPGSGQTPRDRRRPWGCSTTMPRMLCWPSWAIRSARGRLGLKNLRQGMRQTQCETRSSWRARSSCFTASNPRNRRRDCPPGHDGLERDQGATRRPEVLPDRRVAPGPTPG